MDDFIEEYPLATIQTSVEAVSEHTLGGICPGSSGTVTFATINFIERDYYNEQLICNYHEASFIYDLGVEIGFGFKNAGNELLLRPFINGWIYNIGPYAKSIDIEFNVKSISFHPKSNTVYSVNLIQ